MGEGPRVVTWRGDRFCFERLKNGGDRSPVWAVSRRGEFIGTMPRLEEETTREFDVRSVQWIATLVG